MKIRDVQAAICRYYNIRLERFIGEQRAVPIVRPRQIAMYICFVFYGKSYSEIGRAFDRHHTTVMHACDVIEHLVKSGDAVNLDVAAITSLLGSGVVVVGDA
jgi:chromosomal replication initiator protein